MKNDANLYELLEVSPNASHGVIKAAYRCLAQRNHPDKHAGAPAAGERLAQINHAYGVLSDAALRAGYDARVGLTKSVVERRGSGHSQRGGAAGRSGASKASRAFVFRDLS